MNFCKRIFYDKYLSIGFRFVFILYLKTTFEYTGSQVSMVQIRYYTGDYTVRSLVGWLVFFLFRVCEYKIPYPNNNNNQMYGA